VSAENVVIGHKTFYVLPPSAEELLEPSTQPQHTNTSTIPFSVSAFLDDPVLSADGEGVPAAMIAEYKVRLSRAFELPGACQVVLRAGDSVLVPERWWHAAEGINGPGVGVGAWFR